MCRFSQCCFCKLVLGVYIIAGWTIFKCTAAIGAGIYLLFKFDGRCIYRKPLKVGDEWVYDSSCRNSFDYIAVSCAVVLVILWLLSAGGLIDGAVKKRRHAYIPWIVLTSIVLLLNFMGICFIIYLACKIPGYFDYAWFTGYRFGYRAGYPFIFMYIALIWTWIYSLIMICSHFRQLKQEQFQAPDAAHLTSNIVLEDGSPDTHKEAFPDNYICCSMAGILTDKIVIESIGNLENQQESFRVNNIREGAVPDQDCYM